MDAVRIALHVNVLILGADGMLGRAVRGAFSGEHVTAAGHASVDITHRTDVEQLIQRVGPDLVVNCAACTHVDLAEREEARATLVNGDGTRNVLEGCRRVGAALMHISTDYVFDGECEEGYAEDAPRRPINAYGRSKAAGEAAVEGYERLYLVRTSWMFGPHGRHFVDTILRLGRRTRELRVVDDQHGSPAYSPDLADALRRLATASPCGTYHIANGGTCSWWEFACEIVRQAGLDCRVLAVSTEAYGSPTPRPRTSILLNTKLPPLRHWRSALASYLAEQEPDR